MNALIIKIQIPPGCGILQSSFLQLFKSNIPGDTAVYVIIKDKELMSPDHKMYENLEKAVDKIPGASLEYIVRKLTASDQFLPLHQPTELLTE